MQFIKNNFYKITTLVAIAILVVSQSQFYVKAQESENPDIVTEEVDPGNETTEDSFPEFNANGVVHAQPHSSCWMDAYYLTPRSTTYNAVSEYNVSFVPTENGGPAKAQSFFQDINGDNLPDYVYAYNYTGIGGSTLMSYHVGCIYLHNGSGWDKVYTCYARTDTSISTGNVVLAEYGGDCAGEEN